MLFILLQSARCYYGLVFILFFSTMAVSAQQKLGKVTGNVVDEKLVAIPFAQILLKRSVDSSTVKAIIADEREILVSKFLMENIWLS